MNPLCQLKKKNEPNIWANSVKESYKKKKMMKKDYIQQLSYSDRSFYKNSKSMEDELLPGIVEVTGSHLNQ